MLDSVLTGGVITMPALLMCTAASLVLGVVIAAGYLFRNTASRSFIMTLILLPAVVQMVIMLVDGNLGTGVAVAGAFSLVRFRSVPGSAREICSLFLAMMLGLATGTGYLGIAAIATVILTAAQIVLTLCPMPKSVPEQELKITIPESLDYTGVFDDLFDEYTRSHELMLVKTTNMGSLYELRYHIQLKDMAQEKKFLDELRCRNGNLTISCGRVPTVKETL